ncbi:uncharacterized protein EHS24_009467 [Apiotrichum porosum]|uniref:Uncharacterized protein n=1 Tax=Apiotrichum porosum TaxID=105984 RepID=A0A427XM67_9TREE|nr:uncharacterized protein EHS24_009467 [Apiotrichum porosum]RSH79807.1 hypothetical protein EHS24_009467 [Apiotrichum porosum]
MSRPRVSSRKTPPSPLALAAIILPPAPPSSPPSPSPRRRRAHQMRLRDPGCYGLYTLSEEEEDDHKSSRFSWASSSSSSSYSPSSPTTTASVDSHDLYTPGSENEDPFLFEDWGMEVDTPTISNFRGSKTSAPVRPSRRPPPLDLEPYHIPVRMVRTPTARSARFSGLKPPRVSTASSTALPRTPTVASTPELLPALPILAHDEWNSRRQGAASSEPQTPATPLSPSTPTPSEPIGINLVSALRELLTSCGEYEGFANEEMFADAIEFGQPPKARTPPPCPPKADPVTPFCKYAVQMPRAPRATTTKAERRTTTVLGDHSYLQSLSAECRENIMDADEDMYPFDTRSLRSIPSLPSLSPCSSFSSLSSASSAVSLSSMASASSYTSLGSVSGSSCHNITPPPATKATRRVSSRRQLPVRTALPSSWTGYI